MLETNPLAVFVPEPSPIGDTQRGRLAFLAPDIIRDVLTGKQPIGFTSDWCKARPLPSDWQDQRALLATL